MHDHRRPQRARSGAARSELRSIRSSRVAGRRAPRAPEPERILVEDGDPRRPLAAVYGDPTDWIGGRRARRILSSIQHDVDAGGTARVRMVLSSPEEIFRIEVERPDMAYVRTTLMGREALTALLEETPEDVIRERFHFSR